MLFGVEKCQTISISKGRWEEHHGFGTKPDRIRGMEKNEINKYLGYHQAQGIKEQEAKVVTREGLKKRNKLIRKKWTVCWIKIKALNTCAITVLSADKITPLVIGGIESPVYFK